MDETAISLVAMSDYFRQQTQDLLSKYSKVTIFNFYNLSSDVARVEYLYNLHTKTHKVEIDIDEKCEHLAHSHNEQGKDYYKIKNYEKSISQLNKGIIACPQDTDGGRKLLCSLLNNRSAAFYYAEDYSNSLNDIMDVLAIGAYSENRLYNLWCRKARIEKRNHSYMLALSSFKTALEWAEKSQCYFKVIECIKNEFQNILTLVDTESSQSVLQTNTEEQQTPAIKEHNNLFPSASASVDQAYNVNEGKYMFAKQKIVAGETLVVEKPHAAVLSFESSRTNCQNCMISVRRPVPCPRCKYVVFCSRSCLNEAEETYHRYECCIYGTLIDSGASVNCTLALRIVTMRDLAFFKTLRKTCETFDALNTDKNLIEEPHLSSDYMSLFRLCTNSEIRKPELFIGYTNMAVFLLRLLKLTGFFPENNSKGAHLSDQEAFIGSLLLRHLQLLEFNAHEISEIRYDKDFPNDLEHCKNVHIGAGIYPTVAYFNHSCNPGIVRYNAGSKMVVRALKNHNIGDHIYENYGPVFSQMNWKKRFDYLLERYWFQCNCIACNELWYDYGYLPNTLKYKCRMEDCSGGLDGIVCEDCQTQNNVLLAMQEVGRTEELLATADRYFKRGEPSKALGYYLETMQIFNDHLIEPFMDYILVANKIRICMLVTGNKTANLLKNVPSSTE